MKIKFWQFEYDFDKDDAKIVIPVILLVVAVSATNIDSTLLIGASVIYYLFYFFLEKIVAKVVSLIPKPKLKCPNCKNKKIILQGYQGYKSDEQYAYYFCTSCKNTSILTDGGLLQI